ncbi:LPXTG cell wall anchor domain-containing protein [Enterococcus plantarum]|uniref:LPXTG cell wall anchor domain-containing protein n=1 Tax=Enterococcus plantarum TaxID=1077675 RepID=UPI001A8D4131|nr:LPXTG cell wall anchor domain-containing protein [Enterococcus plantarum]
MTKSLKKPDKNVLSLPDFDFYSVFCSPTQFDVEPKFMEVSQEVIYVYIPKSVSPKPDDESEKEQLAEKQQETKSKEKTNLLPRTGEKYTRQVSYMYIGLMFISASMIISFKRLKEI